MLSVASSALLAWAFLFCCPMLGHVEDEGRDVEYLAPLVSFRDALKRY